MTRTITIKMPPLYPKQRAAFFNDERISVCEASTKAGKTVGAISWQLNQAVVVSRETSHLWVAPVYTQAKIAFDRTSRFLTRMDPMKETGWDTNRSDLYIKVMGGSTIHYKGSDNPDSIYGPDYSSAVVDEASRCKEEAWHAVRSTTTATRGPIRIIGNVKGRKNWAYNLARKAESGEPGMAYHKITAADAVAAGVLDAAEIEEARRILPENVFRELYLAEPSDDGGNPFGLAAIRACVGQESMLSPVVYGVDLAKSQDWTWVVGLDGEGRQSVSERWQSDWGQTRRRILDIIGFTPTLIDSTGVGDPIVEDLQRQRNTIEAFKFTSTSKQQLMEGLASAIQQQRISFSDPALIAELETFEYEYTRTGCRYTAPPGLHDDGVCSLALAVRKLDAPSHEPVVVVIGESGNDVDPFDRGWR